MLKEVVRVKMVGRATFRESSPMGSVTFDGELVGPNQGNICALKRPKRVILYAGDNRSRRSIEELNNNDQSNIRPHLHHLVHHCCCATYTFRFSSSYRQRNKQSRRNRGQGSVDPERVNDFETAAGEFPYAR